MQDGFLIRNAEKKDSALILDFIKLLAQYENMESEVTATVKDIEDSVFNKKEAQVIIGEEKGKPVAFALFFVNYSTFLGKSNLYLEDLFVKKEYRGKGYGKMMLRELAKRAVDKGCKRLDWMCLEWNTPSIDFYKSLGAKMLDEWRLFRLEGEKLQEFAK